MKPAIDKLRELAPCYVYDAGAIETACSALARALPQFDFLYSVKANPFAPVVRTAAACGLGADAASPAEVGIAAACGIAPEDIYYSAPGKTEGDLRRTLGRCTVIADSLGELRLIERIAAEAGGKTYLVVRSGMNGFARPAVANLVGRASHDMEPGPMEPLYTGPHAFEARVLGDAPDFETADVVGSLCTATDVIAEGVRVRRARVGDIVEVTNAGSYARTLSPLAFAGFDAPNEYLLDRSGNLISE